MKDLLIFSIVLVMAASCSSARKAKKTPENPIPVENSDSTGTETPKTDSAAVMESISSVLGKLNHIDYTSFSGRAAVEYTNKDDRKNFDVKIQMQKDSLIWVSVIGPLGIEGARAMITKDSVKIINRLQKQYISTSYVYLQEQLGLPLDLGTLQDLLIGNPIFIDKFNSSYTKQGEDIQITSQTRFFRNLLDAAIPDYLPIQSQLNDLDASKKRSAALSYSNYELKNGMQFPKNRMIKVQYKSAIKIQLDYKNFNFNEALSTPFSVPKGYKTKK